MNKIKLIFASLLGMALQFCIHSNPEIVKIPEPPKMILHPKPLGDGGLITRDLFRSFWMLPSSDSSAIRIGIIPSSKSIRLRVPHHFIIRVYGEHESWDVASPGDVTWEFEFESIVRPPVLRYLVTVGEVFAQQPNETQNELIKKWKDRGFLQTQWLGPPKMDSWNEREKIKRFFLTLNVENEKSSAESACKEISQQFLANCKIITRMDLPHLGKGKFRALESNFEKEFEGVIEIIPSKKDPVEIFNIKTQLLSDTRETLLYKPRIFIIPNLENELSLVQSTTMNDYLKSVVPSEIFSESPIEALKAQAVIARTYAFQSKTYYSDKPFLTCASTLCQAYLGEKTISKDTLIEKAIQQTKDMVLKEPGGKFSETFYHAASGGKTEIKQLTLGGAPKPYLTGVSDILESHEFDLTKNEAAEQYLNSNLPTFCSISRFSKGTSWSYHFDKEKIETMLEKIGLHSPLQNIEVLQRGFSGRTLAIKIRAGSKEKFVRGELQIRSLFGGLPSSFIIFKPQIVSGYVQSLTVLGRGSGHGVGLSQMGAIGRALEGQDYQQILNTYYPGTILTSIESD